MQADHPHIQTLISFLSFPSVSTDSTHRQDVRDCADFLIEKLSSMGLNTELHLTEGHPIVIGKTHFEPKKKTVLIYGHYDVQPADPLPLWKTPPFTPTIIGDKIFARGSTDNKGQMLAHLLGVSEELKEKGELPVNLIFLFEGEEEIGSEHLPAFLKEHAKELACDVIVVSDTGMVAEDTPTLGYGLRGISCCEITLKGPSADLHSGIYGGAITNPATALSQLIASLHDSKGRVAVDGFYDEVASIEDWEIAMWKDIPGTSDEDILTQTQSPSTYGEEGFSTAQRLWARPTAEVNGIWGGYQGEGSKTIIPAEASAKLSFRLVPNQSPEKIMEKVSAHLHAHCPQGVTLNVDIGHSGPSYHCDPHSTYGKAAQKALEMTFHKPPVLIREGGSIPIIATFKEILGVDSLMLGLALPDCKIHSPNENFSLKNFEAGIALNRTLLHTIATSS